MNRFLQGIYCLIVIFTFVTARAQDASASGVQAQPGRLPYEVVITPTITRSDLRRLIIDVEEDFFARFNELNIDDAYDVFCYEYVPTMSHIKERVCEPAFMILSRSENAAETAFILGTTSTTGGVKSSAFVLPPKAMRKEKHVEYVTLQEKMEQLTRSDTEFRSIGNALAELKSRLENFGKD